MIAASVVSDVTSVWLDRAAFVSCRVDAYSSIADSLRDGEFLIDDSITKPTEAIPVTSAFEPVEEPPFHAEKNKEDACHAKRLRKKQTASSLPGSQSGLRRRGQLSSSCRVPGEEVCVSTRSPAKDLTETDSRFLFSTWDVVVAFRMTCWLSSRNSTDNWSR